MGYYTKNEIENFAFTQAQIFEVKEYRDQLILDLGYVIIKANNSCNRDVFDMGTNELRLRLYGVSDIKITRLGCKIYNADGKLMSESPDEVLAKEQQEQIFETWNGGLGQITAMRHETEKYSFDVETEEDLYLFEVAATENSQEWERFRRLPSEY